jgi:hypothetical protein
METQPLLQGYLLLLSKLLKLISTHLLRRSTQVPPLSLESDFLNASTHQVSDKCFSLTQPDSQPIQKLQVMALTGNQAHHSKYQQRQQAIKSPYAFWRASETGRRKSDWKRV